MKQFEIANLLNQEDEERVATVLRHVEDVDLHQWRMPDIKAFNIGLRDERARLNCITNPFMFEQVCFLMPTLLYCIHVFFMTATSMLKHKL